jgi:1,4-dihydroxy-6-naphthoate synthase
LKLSLAYSSCPNDTFMFHDLATGRLGLPGCEFEVHLDDVETLNASALVGRFDITKLSCHAWLLVREGYEMLDVGAALGYGCGPVVIARQPMDRAALATARVAVPGELTTAHLLLRLWQPDLGSTAFERYDRIMDLMASGEADAGVVIHEGRFVYEQAGFKLVADLGQWWEEETGLPIPLGCIAARRDLGDRTIWDFERLLREAIENSLANPAGTLAYVREHAQEMDGDVLNAHIGTFVNEFSLDLGDEGRAAVDTLARMAAEVLG